VPPTSSGRCRLVGQARGSSLVAALIVLTAAGCAATLHRDAAMADDDAAIRAELDAFEAAWNRGDAAAAASFFTEDGVRMGAFGDVQHGRAELEAAYEDLLHGAMAGATVRQGPPTVRMLTPGLAVVQGSMEIVPAGDGPVMRGHVVQIMTKVNGRWLVLEAHPKLFPPRPSEPGGDEPGTSRTDRPEPTAGDAR
jgi:uncharacterized protein (TIGR02246 family)